MAYTGTRGTVAAISSEGSPEPEQKSNQILTCGKKGVCDIWEKGV